MSVEKGSSVGEKELATVGGAPKGADANATNDLSGAAGQSSTAESLFAQAASVGTPDDETGYADPDGTGAPLKASETGTVPSVGNTAEDTEMVSHPVGGQADVTTGQQLVSSHFAGGVSSEQRGEEKKQTDDDDVPSPVAQEALEQQEAGGSAILDSPSTEQTPQSESSGGGSVPPVVPGGGAPADNDEESSSEDGEGGRMPLMGHLRELRRRLMYSVIAAFVGFFACWSVVEPIFDVLTRPLLAVLPAGSSAMYTTLPEAFFTRMCIAFVAGLFVVSPFIFYQIWAFISPGLYEEEKHFIIPVAVISAIFFMGGGLFCYFVVFHYAFSFFVSFATEQIVAMPKISDYLDFVLKLILAFGLVFEMPIFSFFLARMGLITAEKMRSVRRYAILAVFIVAAIMTPPDVVSQLLMAAPMLVLYEISILVAALFGKRKPAEDEVGSGQQASDGSTSESAGETSFGKENQSSSDGEGEEHAEHCEGEERQSSTGAVPSASGKDASGAQEPKTAAHD